jgi:hypothetical protein
VRRSNNAPGRFAQVTRTRLRSSSNLTPHVDSYAGAAGSIPLCDRIVWMRRRLDVAPAAQDQSVTKMSDLHAVMTLSTRKPMTLCVRSATSHHRPSEPVLHRQGLSDGANRCPWPSRPGTVRASTSSHNCELAATSLLLVVGDNMVCKAAGTQGSRIHHS